MKRFDLTEFLITAICLMFAVIISLYHVSYNGFLGLSDKIWGSVWAISENGFMLTLSIIIILFNYGVIRTLFKYVFIPYFTIKLIYHFSCLSGVYLLAKGAWSNLWSIICVSLFILCLVMCLQIIKKRKSCCLNS